MGMVQEVSSASYAPALNESLSHVTFLHFRRRTAVHRGLVHHNGGCWIQSKRKEECMLSVEKEHGSNRDSSTSMVSTVTVTAATIVQNASIGKPATASFFDPIQARDDDERKAGSLVASSNLDSPMSFNFSNGSSGLGSSSLLS
jgi:hypothetical protein